MSKGLINEVIASREIHDEGTPLLVSAKILRKNGCGQIDLARIKPDLIEIFEIKSNEVSSQFLNFRQRARLFKTSELIGTLFNRNVIIRSKNINEAKRYQ